MVIDGRVGGDLGGPKNVLLLAKMTLGGCERLGKMFEEDLRGEAGPSGVIAGIDRRGPCQYNGAESGAMEIADKIRLGCNFVGAVRIRCRESQSVAEGGGRARREVDIVETVAGVAITGEGDVLFDQCEMGLGKVIIEAVVVELSDGN